MRHEKSAAATERPQHVDMELVSEGASDPDSGPS